jgi:hypothetical protein
VDLDHPLVEEQTSVAILVVELLDFFLVLLDFPSLEELIHPLVVRPLEVLEEELIVSVLEAELLEVVELYLPLEVV